MKRRFIASILIVLSIFMLASCSSLTEQPATRDERILFNQFIHAVDTIPEFKIIGGEKLKQQHAYAGVMITGLEISEDQKGIRYEGSFIYDNEDHHVEAYLEYEINSWNVRLDGNEFFVPVY